MKDACEIAIVLDRSGSMQEVKEATIQGFNVFLGKQKEAPGDCRLSLAQFDHEYEIVQDGNVLADVPELTAATYVPRGTTALLDAIGRTITAVSSRLQGMVEGERPDKVLFVIITDGLENASKEFTREKVFEMIEHQRKQCNWEFVFLGAGQDAIASGASMGIHTSANFKPTNEGTRSMYAAVTCGALAYRGGSKVSSLDFTPQD